MQRIDELRFNLRASATLIGTKHDSIGCLIGERVQRAKSLSGKDLKVGTTAVKTVLKAHLVLNNEVLAGGIQHRGELGDSGVVTRLLRNEETLVACNARVLLGLGYRKAAVVLGARDQSLSQVSTLRRRKRVRHTQRLVQLASKGSKKTEEAG